MKRGARIPLGDTGYRRFEVVYEKCPSLIQIPSNEINLLISLEFLRILPEIGLDYRVCTKREL